jgi:hypothetical protein
VGDDVDPNLLDALAENHRGLTTYVRPFQAIDEAVSGFYAKISAPVLTDVALDFGGVIVEQLYPATLPDLFAGTQLALVGRYREGGPATITLSGEVNGRSQTFRYTDNQFQTAGGEAFIPRLWATRAIGHLLREIRLHGDNPELIQSIVNLSIRYGIITPYTSYLIEEDDIFSQTRREAIGAGVANEAAAPRSGAEMVEEAAARPTWRRRKRRWPCPRRLQRRKVGWRRTQPGRCGWWAARPLSCAMGSGWTRPTTRTGTRRNLSALPATPILICWRRGQRWGNIWRLARGCCWWWRIRRMRWWRRARVRKRWFCRWRVWVMGGKRPFPHPRP